MKYFILGMLIVFAFSLRPIPAQAACDVTFTNCLSDSFMFCSYNGSSFWDTLYSYNSGTISSGDTSKFDGCEEANCYFVGEEGDDFFTWLCVTIGVSGDSDGCDNYACVDDSDGLQWYSGSSEYSCSDNICTTD